MRFSETNSPSLLWTARLPRTTTRRARAPTRVQARARRANRARWLRRTAQTFANAFEQAWGDSLCGGGAYDWGAMQTAVSGLHLVLSAVTFDFLGARAEPRSAPRARCASSATVDQAGVSLGFVSPVASLGCCLRRIEALAESLRRAEVGRGVRSVLGVCSTCWCWDRLRHRSAASPCTSAG